MSFRKVIEYDEGGLSSPSSPPHTIEHRKILNYVEIGDIFGGAEAGEEDEGTEKTSEDGEEEEVVDLDGILTHHKRSVTMGREEEDEEMDGPENIVVSDEVEEEGEDEDNIDLDRELEEEMRRAEELANDSGEDTDMQLLPRESVDDELEAELRRSDELLKDTNSNVSSEGDAVINQTSVVTQSAAAEVWSEEEEDKEELLGAAVATKKAGLSNSTTSTTSSAAKMRMYADEELEDKSREDISRGSVKNRVQGGKSADFKAMLKAEKKRQKEMEFADIDPAKIVITMDNDDDDDSDDVSIGRRSPPPPSPDRVKKLAKKPANGTAKAQATSVSSRKRKLAESPAKSNAKKSSKVVAESSGDEDDSRVVERVVDQSKKKNTKAATRRRSGSASSSLSSSSSSSSSSDNSDSSSSSNSPPPPKKKIAKNLKAHSRKKPFAVSGVSRQREQTSSSALPPLPIFSNRTQVVKRSFEGVSSESRSELESVQRNSPGIVISKPFGEAGLPRRFGGIGERGAAVADRVARPSIHQRLKASKSANPTTNVQPQPFGREFRGIFNKLSQMHSESEDDDDEDEDDQVLIEYDDEDDSYRALESPPLKRKKGRQSSPNVEKQVTPLSRSDILARMTKMDQVSAKKASGFDRSRLALGGRTNESDGDDDDDDDDDDHYATQVGGKEPADKSRRHLSNSAMDARPPSKPIRPQMDVYRAPGKRNAENGRNREGVSTFSFPNLLKGRLGGGRGKSEGKNANSDGDDRYTDEDADDLAIDARRNGAKSSDLRDRLGLKSNVKASAAASKFGAMRADGEKRVIASASSRLGKRDRTRSPHESRQDLFHRSYSPKSSGAVREETMDRLDRIERNLSLAHSVASSRGKLRSDR